MGFTFRTRCRVQNSTFLSRFLKNKQKHRVIELQLEKMQYLKSMYKRGEVQPSAQQILEADKL